MKKSLVFCLAASAFLHSSGRAQTPPCQSSAAPSLPKLSGVVTNVRNINTAELLQQMSIGSPLIIWWLSRPIAAIGVNSPENSDSALIAAFDNGTEAIEIDLRLSQDNVLVVSHDADVIKETTGTGFISNMTWAQISHLMTLGTERKCTVPAEDAAVFRCTQHPQQLSIYSLWFVAGAGTHCRPEGGQSLEFLFACNPAGPTAGAPRRSTSHSPQDEDEGDIHRPNTGIQAAFTAHPGWGHIIGTV